MFEIEKLERTLSRVASSQAVLLRSKQLPMSLEWSENVIYNINE